MEAQLKDEAFSPEEREEWFKKHDSNGDGQYDKTEFLNLVDSTMTDVDAARDIQLPPSMVDKIFSGSPKISQDDVLPAVKRCTKYIAARGRLLDLFDSVDTDKNGSLSHLELRALMQRGSPEGYTCAQPAHSLALPATAA